MCGICGVVRFDGQAIDPDLALDMTEMVRHRGPNGGGLVGFPAQDGDPRLVALSPTAAPWAPAQSVTHRITSDEDRRAARAGLTGASTMLGHRRLAVIDLSDDGRQPMTDPSGRYWIVFNGEIYNYREIRKELEALGDSFRTACDTEVLLAAFVRWGEACLDRFIGMFAFAIWDIRERRLFAARDRFGIKPLYIVHNERRLAFASEIKQLLILPDLDVRPNPARIGDYLAFGHKDHRPDTFFAGVQQLPPAHCLVTNRNGQVSTSRYWGLDTTPVSISMDAAAQGFLDLLRDAIRLRLRSDVPVGSCLSGGLDSSTIVHLVNRILRDEGVEAIGDRQKTFSSCFDDPRFDESRYIDLVVAESGVDSHRVSSEPERLLEELRSMIWHQDEPPGSSSIYAQWCVFRLVREQGVTVVLDGQGADELLAGYHHFFWDWFVDTLGRDGALETLREIAAYRALGYGWPHAARVAAWTFLPAGLRTAAGRRRAASRVPWYLPPRTETPTTGPPDRTAEPDDPTVDDTMLTRSLSRLLTSESVPRLLAYEDRNSMAFSVEARVPFLDHRLAEFVARLPDEHKIGRGDTKRVLRQAVQGIIPDAVRARRDRMGFVTPESVWIRDFWSDRIRSAAGASLAVELGLADGVGLQRAVADILDGKRFDHLAWRVMALEAWRDIFL